MTHGIIKICISYFKKQGVEFTTRGKHTIPCTFEGDSDYWWSTKYPYKLNHKDKYKEIDSFSEIIKIPTYKKQYSIHTEESMNELLERDEKDSYQVHVNTQNLKRHPKEVTNFLDNYDILKVSSPMATRKSNVIQEVIDQSHSRGLRVLMITNRRSLAKDSDKYDGGHISIRHYRERDYKSGDSLVVQFDSLYLYNTDKFDIIILDEISSLLLYLSNPYVGKEHIYRQNIEKFMSLKQKKVISDAFIIDTPFFTDETEVLGIYNNFREDLEVIEYQHKEKFLREVKLIGTKERISFSSNEKGILNRLEKYFKKKGRKVLKLTADTPKETKKEFYKIFAMTGEIEPDVILYSPTLTVGVSILGKIMNHFHYDTSSTIDPVSSIQMTRRVRNSKRIHFFIRGISSYKSVDINTIKYQMDLFKMVNKYGKVTGITNAGKMLSYVRQMSNICRNSHKYVFKTLMTYQFNKVELNTQLPPN